MPLSRRDALPYDQQLPLDSHYINIHAVCTALPPPATPDPHHPDDIIARDNAAVAIIASLVPVGAAEADLAGRYVIASAQAKEAMRKVMLAGDDNPKEQDRCMRWHSHCSRLANGCIASLLRLQNARCKREATLKGASRDAWVEHCLIGHMASALGRTGTLSDNVPPSPEEPDEPPPPPDPGPGLTEAERFAATYPDRARLIRDLGGPPADTVWMPPPKAVIDELLTSTSPIISQALNAAA